MRKKGAIRTGGRTVLAFRTRGEAEVVMAQLVAESSADQWTIQETP